MFVNRLTKYRRLSARLRMFLFLTVWSSVNLVAQPNILTYHNDNARTGLNANETILTLSNVNAATFGKLFSLPVDGRVDAQPLYVSNVTIGDAHHNVVYVATEHDSVYAFDADNAALLWHVSLLKTAEIPSDDRGCGQVTPEMGITATPVIDLTAAPNGLIYVVAMSRDSLGNYHQRLHALDLKMGTEQLNGPVEIQASYQGSGDNSSGGRVIFDPKQYKERPGLLLLNGVVYTGWSSHCDIRPYTAWVIGYGARTLAQTTVLNLTPNGNEGSVWASGGGPAADGAGNIYFLMANGTFDTTLVNGFPEKGDFGNSFVKLSTVNNTLKVSDYFAMFNVASENSVDQDLGSGGALLLPDMVDAAGKIWHLAVGAGKDANIYVVDRDNMGKFNPTTNNIYQELPGALAGWEMGTPAYFNSTIYFGAWDDFIRAFAFSNARLVSNPTSHTANHFRYPGATPSISANGTSNAILWAVEDTASAVLHAYNATDLSRELYNSTQAANSRDSFGNGNKFITPTIANGKVYVGTPNSVGVFGTLPTGVASTVAATRGTPQTTTVNTAFPIALQVTVKNANGNPVSAVNVTFKAPATGARGTFSGSATVTVATNGSGVATAPAFTANTIAGSYTVTATVPGVATPANFSLANNAAVILGSLVGSGNSANTPTNLTTEGNLDWVHWGEASLNRKAGVTAQLSSYTVVGSGSVLTYTNDPRTLNWTDGAPTLSSTNNHNGIYINRTGNGFSFTAPADKTSRTLIIHVGGWYSAATLTAHLSDGSSPDFTNVTAPAVGQYDRNYTVVYNAASVGQSLTVTWSMISGTGNVTLNGAALATGISVPPIMLETEALPATSSGPPHQVFNWSGFTDGIGTILYATANGDSVTYTGNISAAATYNVKVAVKDFNIRGQWQLSIDGTNQGSQQDEYAPVETWAEFDLGNVIITSPGPKNFKFTVVGKNAQSTGYRIAFDYIKLTPQ